MVSTDGEGRYRATNIVVGPVSVKAVKGVFAGVSSGNIGRAGTFATVNVALNESGGSVSGRVGELVGDVAMPLAGMEVYYVIPHELREIVFRELETAERHELTEEEEATVAKRLSDLGYL